MHTFDKISLQISFCSDANLVLITSDCCEGPPANAFLDCFDFSMGLYVGQKGQA